MKKTLIILTLITNHLFSQECKYSDLFTENAPGGLCTSYLSKAGTLYKIGEILKIGVPANGKLFSYITEGDGFKAPITPLTSIAGGRNIEIKKMNISGNKTTGFLISLKCKGTSGSVIYNIDLENALESGEILIPDAHAEK